MIESELPRGCGALKGSRLRRVGILEQARSTEETELSIRKLKAAPRRETDHGALKTSLPTRVSSSVMQRTASAPVPVRYRTDSFGNTSRGAKLSSLSGSVLSPGDPVSHAHGHKVRRTQRLTERAV